MHKIRLIVFVFALIPGLVFGQWGSPRFDSIATGTLEGNTIETGTFQSGQTGYIDADYASLSGSSQVSGSSTVANVALGLVDADNSLVLRGDFLNQDLATALTGTTAGLVLSNGTGGTRAAVSGSDYDNTGTRRLNVSKYATAGDGTAANPWTGWSTSVPITANSTYFFRAGYYSAQSWIFDSEAGNVLANIDVIGEPGTILKLAGTTGTTGAGGFIPAGTALGFVSSSRDLGIIPQCITLKNLVIDGAGTAAIGILWDRVWTINTENVRVRNLPGVGMDFKWGICGNHTNFTISGYVDSGFVMPTTGVLIENDGATNYYSTCQTFSNIRLEQINGDGVDITQGSNNQFLNGTLENNLGWGGKITNPPANPVGGNIFLNVDIEANSAGSGIYSNPQNYASNNVFIGGVQPPTVTGPNSDMSIMGNSVSGLKVAAQLLTNIGGDSNNNIVIGSPSGANKGELRLPLWAGPSQVTTQNTNGVTVRLGFPYVNSTYTVQDQAGDTLLLAPTGNTVRLGINNQDVAEFYSGGESVRGNLTVSGTYECNGAIGWSGTYGVTVGGVSKTATVTGGIVTNVQ